MFKVTGKMPNGKRFKPIHTSNANYALAINLYQGTVWQMINGRWKMIKRVVN